MFFRHALGLGAVLGVLASAVAGPRASENPALVLANLPLVAQIAPHHHAMPIGVTADGRAIPAWFSDDDLDLNSRKRRVVLVAGVDEARALLRPLVDAWNRYATNPEYQATRDTLAVSLLIVPRTATTWPPTGTAYQGPHAAEWYAWNWLALHAPDGLLEIVLHETSLPESAPDQRLHQAFRSAYLPAARGAAAERWALPNDTNLTSPTASDALLAAILQRAAALTELAPTKRRLELARRSQQSASTIATTLARQAPRTLPQVQYIPAFSLWGQCRLDQLQGTNEYAANVDAAVSDFRSATVPALTEKSGGPEIAGHYLFGAIYDRTHDEQFARLIRAAADRAFTADGEPREFLPGHQEMSDSVFMGCPVLALAARVTGEEKYAAMCVRHFRFMARLNLRPDGLHQHSPLCTAAWGRGNGFPALGLALAISELPAASPQRAELATALRNHLDALLPHQDVTGCWHQVIDRPESYRELSATSMITFALLRGLRLGLLPAEPYESAARRGWSAIQLRVDEQGNVTDVCTSTGKQPALRDYYDRQAVSGGDGRGRAMALVVATERIAWERDREQRSSKP